MQNNWSLACSLVGFIREIYKARDVSSFLSGKSAGRESFPFDAVYFSGPPISSIHSDFPIQLSSSDFDTNEIIL